MRLTYRIITFHLLITVPSTILFVHIIRYHFPYYNHEIVFALNYVSSHSINDFELMNSSNVQTLIKPPPPIRCNTTHPPIFSSNVVGNNISLNAHNVGYYISNKLNYTCCYRPFFRKNDKEVIYAENCTTVETSANIDDEFIQVQCSENNNVFYTDFFSFGQPKPNPQPVIDVRPLNVMVFGLSSISRLNFIRQMNTSNNFLNTLSPFDFYGYNKVAEGVFDNVIPILTGLSVEELRILCWQRPNVTFDKCPFIWKKFHELGYSTAYGEDPETPYYSLFSGHNRGGFEEQPTDYYFNTFHQEASRNSKSNNSRVCYNFQPKFKSMLNYIWAFVNQMKRANSPFFSFFWENSITPQDFNSAKLADADYYFLFKKIVKANLLENTVIILVSNEGMSKGQIMTTEQGELEEKLPLLKILLPKWYREQNGGVVGNLKKNKAILTTPFDLHEFLLDLLNPNQVSDKYELFPMRFKIARSLFGSIDRERTCNEAEVANRYCATQDNIAIHSDMKVAWDVSEYLVDYVNFVTRNNERCNSVVLNQILKVKLVKSELEGNVLEFQIRVEVLPENAIFEAYVKREWNEFFDVIGEIKRLDDNFKLSGKCIDNEELKHLCICADFKMQ